MYFIFRQSALLDMLDFTCTMLKTENLATLHAGVSGVLTPLREWSACIIRTPEEHERLYYVISRALFTISDSLVIVGLDDLLQEQRRYVLECQELSKVYITYKESALLLGDDDLSEPDPSGTTPVERFKDFIKTVRYRIVREQARNSIM